MDTDSRKRGKRRFFLAPIIGLNKFTGKIIAKSFREGASTAEDVILSMVDAENESGFIDDTGAEIISNAFEFNDLTASDVMTHRVHVVGIEEDAELNDIVYLALEEGFSRFPVYRENIDNIIGIIIVKDLLSLIGLPEERNVDDFSVNSFLREALYVPESATCTSLFKTLTEEKAGMAVVVDEYGGTAGIVTMEDLVEEIMGSIQDEYDAEEAGIKQIGDEKYDIDGETDPEEVLELFGYELPDDHEYDTLAGFMTDLLGFIPEESESSRESTPQVDYEDVRFVAVGVEDNCISRVIAYRRKEEPKYEKKN